MLWLLLCAGDHCYALDVRQVAEVLPDVTLSSLPDAPPHVAGLLNYHGVPVPVVDLCRLFVDRDSRRRLNTRIVLIRDTLGSDGGLLGLRAEAVTETLDLPATALAEPHARPDDAAQLRRNAQGKEQLVVAWQSDRLLPESLRAWLSRQPAGASR